MTEYKGYVVEGGTVKSNKRLLNELILFQDKEKSKSLGFVCQLVNNDLYHWNVKLFNTFDGTLLGEDLRAFEKKFGVDYISVDFVFSGDYPLQPPKVRIISPRFRAGTGHVTPGGLIKMRILAEENWTPVYTVHAIVDEMKSVLVDGAARLEFEYSFYSAQEAADSDGGFYETYRCLSPACAQSEGKFLETRNLGGKILLPPSALSKIVSLPQVKFPLIFELSNSARTKVTHCGVIEFNAPEGVVVLPPWMMHNLVPPSITNLTTPLTIVSNTNNDTNINNNNNNSLLTVLNASDVETIQRVEGSLVNVRMVTLPKGEYVKLKAHDPNFYKLPEAPNDILESVLHTFSALTEGDVFQIEHNDQKFSFTVLETRPRSAIDINNTDIEVEFLLDTKDETQIRSAKEKEKISKSDQKVTQSNSHSETAKGQVIGSVIAGESTIECENCRRQIPKSTANNHILFCKRHHTLCELCGQVVNKNQWDLHITEMHSLVTCACGVQVERYQLATHKKHECNHRLIKCAYCNLQKKATELEKHQTYCGSRTEVCPRCHKRIMLKDLEQHRVSHCKYPPSTTDNNVRSTTNNINNNNSTRPPQESFLSGVLKFLGFS
jgi:ubiquitin-protein ligase